MKTATVNIIEHVIVLFSSIHLDRKLTWYYYFQQCALRRSHSR